MITHLKQTMAIGCFLLLAVFAGCTTSTGSGSTADEADDTAAEGDGTAAEGDDTAAADDGDTTSAALLSAKAVEVAEQIGGGGFGGAALADYEVSVEDEVDFNTNGDLAEEDATLSLQFRNQTQQRCTFRLRYVAAYMGLDEQLEDVSVEAGEDLEITVPCCEILGLGSLAEPGSEGCLLADGQTVDNTMAVPAFLGADFSCGQTYELKLCQDVDDLDGDGDTEELICQSGAMERHMYQHQHGYGGGENGGGSAGGAGNGGSNGAGNGSGG